MAKFSEQWKTLSVKSKIAYITALVAFTLGWGLTIAGFIIGAGIVHDSVLWILGQGLIYAASVFGVGMYVSASVNGMKKSIGKFMAREMKGEVKQEDFSGEIGEEEEDL